MGFSGCCLFCSVASALWGIRGNFQVSLAIKLSEGRGGPTNCARVGLGQSREGGVTCVHLEAGFAAHSLAPLLCQASAFLPGGQVQLMPCSAQWCPGLRAAWEEEGLRIWGGLEGAQQQQMAGPGISMSRQEGRGCAIPMICVRPVGRGCSQWISLHKLYMPKERRRTYSVLKDKNCQPKLNNKPIFRRSKDFPK